MLRNAVLAAALLVLAPAPAPAGDDDNRQKVIDARRSGAILALAEILDRLRPRIGDRIVEIEFERDDGLPVYEIYYIDGSGKRREIRVDASTAKILETESDE